MTSKEALERINNILLRYDEHYDYLDIEVIKQDLERLKELEKEYNTLKKEYDTKDLECCSLQRENHNLKKAIEILKDFFNVGEIYGDYLINANGFNKLSKLDYELLKEVFENETNN